MRKNMMRFLLVKNMVRLLVVVTLVISASITQRKSASSPMPYSQPVINCK
jgi:hypothetical protein